MVEEDNEQEGAIDEYVSGDDRTPLNPDIQKNSNHTTGCLVVIEVEFKYLAYKTVNPH